MTSNTSVRSLSWQINTGIWSICFPEKQSQISYAGEYDRACIHKCNYLFVSERALSVLICKWNVTRIWSALAADVQLGRFETGVFRIPATHIGQFCRCSCNFTIPQMETFVRSCDQTFLRSSRRAHIEYSSRNGFHIDVFLIKSL